MTPRECYNLATAIQRLGMAAYPIDEETKYPSDEIALYMGQISGLATRIRAACADLDPKIGASNG